MLRRTKIMVVAVAAAVAGLAPVAATTASAAPAPYCGITWGSLAKTDSRMAPTPLTNIRAGRHACYDRLVFDMRGGNSSGYRVNYVKTIGAEGVGHAIPLRGGAKLSITVHVPAYNAAGRPTYHFAHNAELVNVTGYRTFREVAWAGTFEGYSTVGLGVRARLPFRVFQLPGRIVVDVAHRW